MNCKKCGNEMATSEVYCQKCGAKAEDISGNTSGTSYTTQPTQPQQSSSQQASGQQASSQQASGQQAQNTSQYSQQQNNQQYQNPYDYRNPYTNQPPQPMYQNNANSPEAVSNVAALIISIASIFVCSNLIFGIIGIVYAVKVSSLNAIGDFQGAKDANKKSIMFTLIGLGLSILGLIAVVVLFLLFPAVFALS